MATHSSYTTIKVSRFGFSVLSVTLNRANTENAKAIATMLIASNTDPKELNLINDQWDLAFNSLNQCVQFTIDAGGDWQDDYGVTIKHFDISEQQVINACRSDIDVSNMFF